MMKFGLSTMLDLEKIYEALLYWRGNLNATEFAYAVGRTRQRVQTQVITPFVQGRETDLQQERGRKHGRTLLGRPTCAPADLWAFFDLLATERNWRRRERQGCSSLAGIDIVDLAPPEPAAAVVWMCRAAAHKRALVGRYLFKNHGVRSVCFSPHTMVRTPRRIHFRGHLLVRALNETQDWNYVDLVPGRFLDDGDLELDESIYRGAEGDLDWHEEIEIAFEINPALPQAAYLALQHEHELEADRDGRCRIKLPVRRALAYSYEHHVFDRTIGPKRMKAWIRCSAAGR